MSTKVCDECDAVVGETETKCPKCGADFAELDEIASAVERGSKILEKRRKRATPAPEPEVVPEPQPLKGVARLRALGRGFNRA